MTIAAQYGLSADDATMFLHGSTETQTRWPSKPKRSQNAPSQHEKPRPLIKAEELTLGRRPRPKRGPNRC